MAPVHLPWAAVRLADLLTQLAYGLSGGRVGGKQAGYSMLLLHTTGRKTGKTRTHTLLYVRDGEHFIVCGSNNGQSHHPAWYHNLQAQPHARIQAGRASYEVVAERAGPEEYERLWNLLLKSRPQYNEYRKRTAREFPIVILKPV
ncbi:MAG TPA: nitroreductase/quinone reductase family protein [Ktedonobacterales bacterium]|jgi:deazaflavin-dependent oxidoreductase (nitroreductase family)